MGLLPFLHLKRGLPRNSLATSCRSFSPRDDFMTTRSRRHFLTTIGSASAALALGRTTTASAQPYPSRPVRYVVALAPGGTSDIVARAITPGLGAALGQPFVVENRPGGGGVIGTEHVAKSPPDGYTLLHTSIAFFTVTPQLTKVSYDPFKDFDPVAFVGTNVGILAIHPSVPATNLSEFIAYAKANPGKLNYASSGSGTGGHLLGEFFKQATGIVAEHVPYKGAAPAVADLLGGRTHFMIDSAVTPHVKSGKLRALAVNGAKTSELIPGLPPMESVLPGWNPPQQYNFISAPAGTPAEVRDRIHSAMTGVLADPKVVNTLREASYEPSSATPAQIRARIKSDYDTTGAFLRAHNVKLD
ncbi:MAG TPA: tripartite tricarboxylate transporter substrate binding protein [Casimicrobiaceae bacterium]|nr:tripartite tricarboxylate transporter substrate binding protein [Casimicrobiaceae bacterium]